MNKITYMIEQNMGQVWSRVASEVAIPVLDWDNMTPENNYATNYQLHKFNVFDVAKDVGNAIHTRKIPIDVKNRHRKFWGMKELKGEK